MKIAAVTDDGVTISPHFGRATHYIVITVEDNKVVAREKRAKVGHIHFAGETHAEGSDSRGHGFDPTAQARHSQMLDAITDCQVVLARGMGAGAYASIRAANISPVVTDIAVIDEAVRAHLAGTLVDHTEKLH
jgi:predicted Fe-Mo cluster-binding NifX family protein